MTAAPPISVLVATRHPWPEIERCVETLLPQLEACGGELIVGDGHGEGIPDPPPGVRVITKVGASVFELRKLALEEARGDIVAPTEDHCWLDPGWCERIIETHRSNPDAVGVTGLVRNGSRRSLAAWASFFVNFAPYTPPFVVEPGSRIPPPANVSYKRVDVPTGLEIGELETTFAATLDQEGRIIVDEGLQLVHSQPYSLIEALTAHFHNGRSTMGLAFASRSRADQRRHIRVVLASSIRLVAETWWHVLKRRAALPIRAIASLPIVAMLGVSWITGAVIGLLRGPGSSPEHID